MSMNVAPWYRGPWAKVRREVLERDGWRCRVELPGCTGEATAVDHVVPPSVGGAWWDPANLRAACRGCNTRRANVARARRRTADASAAYTSRTW